MANNLVKFCTAALAGSLIGIAYEKWPISSSLVSADSSLLPPNAPKDISWDRSGKDITPVDPKVSAEFVRQAARFGLPSQDNLRLFNDFIISYDRRLRSPIWVLEHLTPAKLESGGNVTRNNSKFKADTSLHEYFRASLDDFRGSNLDRGHMAAAANHKSSQDAMDQTFILSNISPQESEFNQGGWERLETFVRWLAKRSRNLYVVTGPLYLPHRGRDGNSYVTYRVIGDNLVSVPTHYFKVILTETHDNTFAMEAFLMPNDPKLTSKINLDFYRIHIDKLDVIERASGLIFFDQLPRNRVERPLEIPANFKPRVYDNHKTKLPAVA